MSRNRVDELIEKEIRKCLEKIEKARKERSTTKLINALSDLLNLLIDFTPYPSLFHLRQVKSAFETYIASIKEMKEKGFETDLEQKEALAWLEKHNIVALLLSMFALNATIPKPKTDFN